ncbi:MAG: class I SAM-dependent methyltransferase [Planctomycetota bacterium]|jgi:hypothetical protein
MTVRDLLPDAYADIEPGEVNVSGWDSEHPIFAELMAEFRPSLVVELGSWLGASALTMAKAARDLGLDCEIVCVDTFLGGAVEVPDDIGWQHGRPLLLERFLANVVGSGFAHVITPFVQTTVNAARWFRGHEFLPDLVYVDAGHEYAEVKADLEAWADLPRRAIFGHDYSENYPGVIAAVGDVIDGLKALDLSRPPFWIWRAA